MPLWQIALIVFVLAWGLQALGTYVQMRHYRKVMGGIAQQWADGFVGAGNSRATFGKGVILLLVVSSDMVVRRMMVMQGRSVFATFKPIVDCDGQPLDRLREGQVFADKARAKALAMAVTQIDKAAQSQSKQAGQPVAA
jgi:glucitol operon activator protein